jgi:hypothetical protein
MGGYRCKAIGVDDGWDGRSFYKFSCHGEGVWLGSQPRADEKRSEAF